MIYKVPKLPECLYVSNAYRKSPIQSMKRILLPMILKSIFYYLNYFFHVSSMCEWFYRSGGFFNISELLGKVAE